MGRPPNQCQTHQSKATPNPIHRTMTHQKPNQALLSRLSQEFESPVEFSPVDFHESDTPLSSHSYDVAPPWDPEEEGSDHAEDLDDARPLHEKNATPHGMMTDILSATEFHYVDSKEDERSMIEQQQQQQQQKKNEQEASQRHQKSLRLRAAKYFRGSTPSSHPSSSPQQSVVTSTKQQIHRLATSSPTSTVSTQPSSTHPLPPQKHSFFPKTSTSPSSRTSTTMSQTSQPNSTYSKYSDPPTYVDEIQSTVSTSISYGSDLENAARRILGRKRYVGRGEDSVGGDSVLPKHHIGTTESLTGQQRRPSTERMERITRRSIVLPARYGSESELESEVDEDGTNPDIGNNKSPQTNNLQEDEMTAILRSNAMKNLQRRHRLESEDDDDSLDPHGDGAFPSFTKPDPLVDDSNVENLLEWNGVSPTNMSWVDPEKAFLDVDSHENEYEECADARESLNYSDSDFVNKSTKEFGSNVLDDDWYQHPPYTRCVDDSSLEGDAGKDEESENEEFDGNDYFHEFALTSDRSWGVTRPTDWEDLPSPVQFSPIRRSTSIGWEEDAAVDLSRVDQEDEYVTRTSEIDFFAWDDDGNGNNADFGEVHQLADGGLSSNQQIATKFDNQNVSMESPADDRNNRQPNHTYPFSDGDTPTRKSKKGLLFFRSRNQPDKSWNYQSEGERSDSDWESSPANQSFGLSPMRSTRWKNKQKMSPRSLKFFGERRQDKHRAERESVLEAQYEILCKDSIGSVRKQSDKTSSAAIAHQTQLRQVTPEPEQTKSNVCNTSVDVTQKDVISFPIHAKSLVEPSTRSYTPITNLNDSGLLTESTPLMSNKAMFDELPRPPSFNKSNPSQSGHSGTKPSAVPPPPRLHNSQPVDKRAPITRKKPPSPGFTGSDIIVGNEENDDCSVSTILTESLGSLVTKPSPNRAQKADGHSVRSGMSEIERLRRENELLREKLENRSEASSRVSSAFVRTLQEQNELLRRQLNNTSPKRHTIKRNDSDMMYKSTIATLLEGEDPSRRTRRNNVPNSPRKPKGVHCRKPIAPLIPGADFDDESITTYSESIKEKKVHLIRDSNYEGVPGILQTIAAQVKTATQDKNNSSRKTRSCEMSFSKPLELMTACTRRDRANNRTPTCATANSTKEVIGRAFGCIKTNRPDDARTNDLDKGSVGTTQSDNASDSLVHGAAHTKREPKTMTISGVAIQM